MSRASKADAAQHRAEILQAASEQLREGGEASVTVQSVMGAVKMTPGGFYNHFRSKDELIAQATANSFAEILALISDDAAADLAPAERWRLLVDEYLSVGHRDDRAHGCANTALATDSARADAAGALRTAYTEGVNRTVEALSLFQDESPSSDARRKRLLALITMIGALTLARATVGDALSEELLEIAREQLVREPLAASD